MLNLTWGPAHFLNFCPAGCSIWRGGGGGAPGARPNLTEGPRIGDQFNYAYLTWGPPTPPQFDVGEPSRCHGTFEYASEPSTETASSRARPRAEPNGNATLS